MKRSQCNRQKCRNFQCHASNESLSSIFVNLSSRHIKQKYSYEDFLLYFL